MINQNNLSIFGHQIVSKIKMYEVVSINDDLQNGKVWVGQLVGTPLANFGVLEKYPRPPGDRFDVCQN